MLRQVLALLPLACLFTAASAQTPVHFPLGRAATELQADVYGSGTRAVILAHGGRFNKESWKPQATSLADAGFLVLSLRFRGDGTNPDGSAEDNAADVLAAIHYLQGRGAKEIDAVGASFGGDAVGDAVAESPPGTLARIVVLASNGGSHPERLSGRKLFIVARDDRSAAGLRLPEIQQHYARAPEPKQMILLEGEAHAQFLFPTTQGPRLMREILTFLTAR